MQLYKKSGTCSGNFRTKNQDYPFKSGTVWRIKRARASCYFEYGMQFSCTTNRDVCSGIVLSKNISCKAGDGYSNIIIVEDIQG